MASSSTVSLQKPLSQRRQSCDTVCSSNSSCYLQKRKPIHPLATPALRAYGSRSNVSSVKQRVLSAKLLKLRSLQNQLNDANFHLTELQQENRCLKTLQMRQDRALSKYEGKNADLPRLLQSHESEIATLQAKNKALRKNLLETTNQLKLREDELSNIKDQLKELTILVKSKNLGERQALADQVLDLQEQLKKYEGQISLMNRKLELESKNFKFKLNAEISKNKTLQRELMQALNEIDKLTKFIEGKERVTALQSRKRFSNINHKQGIISVNIIGSEAVRPVGPPSTKIDEDHQPVTNFLSEVKLEPISNENPQKFISASDILVPPSENIKARLSAKTSKSNLSTNDLTTEVSDQQQDHPKSLVTKQSSRPNSSYKLEKLSNNLQSIIQKTSDNFEDTTLSSYCSEVLTSIKQCTTVVDKHKSNFENSKSETEELLKDLKSTDEIHSKLRHTNFLDTIAIPDEELDLVNKIWHEEYIFRNGSRKSSIKSADNNGNIVSKNVVVSVDEKAKLLATMKAIDNGEEVHIENYRETNAVTDELNTKNKLLTELFGDLNK